jgi:hypothetical protein
VQEILVHACQHFVELLVGKFEPSNGSRIAQHFFRDDCVGCFLNLGSGAGSSYSLSLPRFELRPQHTGEECRRQPKA